MSATRCLLHPHPRRPHAQSASSSLQEPMPTLQAIAANLDKNVSEEEAIKARAAVEHATPEPEKGLADGFAQLSHRLFGQAAAPAPAALAPAATPAPAGGGASLPNDLAPPARRPSKVPNEQSDRRAKSTKTATDRAAAATRLQAMQRGKSGRMVVAQDQTAGNRIDQSYRAYEAKDQEKREKERKRQEAQEKKRQADGKREEDLRVAESEKKALAAKAAELRKAAKGGDTDECKRLIAKGYDAAAKDPSSGNTSLHVASWFDRDATVLALLDAGVDIDVMDDRGRTPLMVAVSNCSTAAMCALVDDGADVELQSVESEFEWSALMYAAARGHADAIGERTHAVNPSCACVPTAPPLTVRPHLITWRAQAYFSMRRRAYSTRRTPTDAPRSKSPSSMVSKRPRMPSTWPLMRARSPRTTSRSAARNRTRGSSSEAPPRARSLLDRARCSTMSSQRPTRPGGRAGSTSA